MYNFNIASMSTHCNSHADEGSLFELRKIEGTSKIPHVVTNFVPLKMENLSDDLLILTASTPINYLPKFLKDRNSWTFAFSILPFPAQNSQKEKMMKHKLEYE